MRRRLCFARSGRPTQKEKSGQTEVLEARAQKENVRPPSQKDQHKKEDVKKKVRRPGGQRSKKACSSRRVNDQ